MALILQLRLATVDLALHCNVSVYRSLSSIFAYRRWSLWARDQLLTYKTLKQDHCVFTLLCLLQDQLYQDEVSALLRQYSIYRW